VRALFPENKVSFAGAEQLCHMYKYDTYGYPIVKGCQTSRPAFDLRDPRMSE